MRQYVRLMFALCFALGSIGVAHAYFETTFINSNNGAALNSNSHKLNCLRGMMMSVNEGEANTFDCSGDSCFLHDTDWVVGRIYACYDRGSSHGYPIRICKIDGPISPWQTVSYTQDPAVPVCNMCPQAAYDSPEQSNVCNVDGFGNPLKQLWYATHRLQEFP